MNVMAACFVAAFVLLVLIGLGFFASFSVWFWDEGEFGMVALSAAAFLGILLVGIGTIAGITSGRK